MSLVTYDGLGLPYPLTSDFQVQPLPDEIGQTDWYCSRYTVDVQCLIGTDYLRAIDPTLAAVDAPSVMNGIKERLQQRRKRLSFKVNGVEQIPQVQQGLPANSSIDASNGPIPQIVKIIDLTNGNFLVRFQIQGDYWNNVNVTEDPNGPNERGSPVLYNRWKETVEIDDRNFSRRIREGKYRIRSDNFQGALADQFRSDLAVVSVPNGFVRESAKYIQTPDGLGLEYTIIDKEVFKPPPNPAFKAQGYLTEETTRGGGSRFVEVNLRLEGQKRDTQDTLIRVGLAICVSKLNMAGAFLGAVPAGIPPRAGAPAGAGGGLPGRLALFLAAGGLLPRAGEAPLRPLNPNGAVLEGAMLRVDLYDNAVEYKMRAMTNLERDRVIGTPGAIGIPGFERGMTLTPLSAINGPYIPPYNNYGSAGILLQAAAYWDPSILNVTLGPGNIATRNNPVSPTGASRVQHTRGRIPGTAGTNPEV